MEKVVLNATKRDVIGKQVKALRREGKLPAVIYGRHTEPVNINLDAHYCQPGAGEADLVQPGDDQSGWYRVSRAGA